MINFRPFQIERVCRQQFKFNENSGKFSKRVENAVGKGEIAHYEQYLLFSVLPKDLSSRHIKTRACMGKG